MFRYVITLFVCEKYVVFRRNIHYRFSSLKLQICFFPDDSRGEINLNHAVNLKIFRSEV